MINFKSVVHEAARKKGILGVMALTKFVDMDYKKVVKVWNGERTTKLVYVEEVLNKLGYKLKAVPIK